MKDFEEEIKKDYENMVLAELSDEIESGFEKRPDGRKKIQLEKWKKEINSLIKIYNTKAGSKVYLPVK